MEAGEGNVERVLPWPSPEGEGASEGAGWDELRLSELRLSSAEGETLGVGLVVIVACVECSSLL